MKPPTRGRIDPKAQRATFRAAESFYQVPQKPMGPIFADEPEKVKRAAPKPSATPLESQVLQEIIACLESRSDIGAIVRTNSGVAVNDLRYTRFNTCLGKHDGQYMTLLDIQCIHKPSGRHVEIEAKRAGWKYTGRANEVKQAARISHLQSCGAVAFFADSVSEVRRKLSKYL